LIKKFDLEFLNYSNEDNQKFEEPIWIKSCDYFIKTCTILLEKNVLESEIYSLFLAYLKLKRPKLGIFLFFTLQNSYFLSLTPISSKSTSKLKSN